MLILKILLLILLGLLRTGSIAKNAYLGNIRDKYESISLNNTASDSSFNKGRLYIGLGYTYGIDLVAELPTYTLNNKKVAMGRISGFGYLINCETSYFFGKYTGFISGMSYRKSHLETLKLNDYDIDTSVYSNGDFLYFNESFSYNSLVLPIHLIHFWNFKLRNGALLFEYGFSAELPLSLSYEINYKEDSSEYNIIINDKTNRDHLQTTINVDISVGFLYKWNNINLYISCYSRSPVRSAISDESEIGYFALTSVSARLGVLYSF